MGLSKYVSGWTYFDVWCGFKFNLFPIKLATKTASGSRFLEHKRSHQENLKLQKLYYWIILNIESKIDARFSNFQDFLVFQKLVCSNKKVLLAFPWWSEADIQIWMSPRITPRRPWKALNEGFLQELALHNMITRIVIEKEKNIDFARRNSCIFVLFLSL